jgi:hypothetical protein
LFRYKGLRNFLALARFPFDTQTECSAINKCTGRVEAAGGDATRIPL